MEGSLPFTLVDPLGLNAVPISHPGCPCADFASSLITAFIPAFEVGVPSTWPCALSLPKYAQIYSLTIFGLSITIFGRFRGSTFHFRIKDPVKIADPLGLELKIN